MAKLDQVRVENFRAFANAEFLIPDQGLIMVAGQNNSGKSALLSALDVIAGQQDINAARAASSAAPAHVWARFRLKDDEREELLGDDARTEDLLARGAAEWVEWDFSEIRNDRMQAVRLSIAWPDVDELLVAQLEMTGPFSYRLLGPGVMPIAKWTAERLTEVSSGSGDPGPFLEQVTNLSALAPLSKVLARWRQDYFHFKPLRQTVARDAVLSSSPVLGADGANLGEVLHHLQSNRPDEWNEVRSLIEEIVPGVGLLMLPSQGNKFSIAFRDTSVAEFYHNLKDLGTGVEQILMTLVAGITGSARTVVLEEPEMGLHPAAQRALLDLLQRWSRNDRVFLASTHSPIFLDFLNATVLSVMRNGSSSSVVEITQDQKDVFLNLGVRTVDVLAADRILILEGKTDQQIIARWFPHIVRHPRVAIIIGEGGDTARHADLLSSWLELSDKLGDRRLLYVRDRDELGREAENKLSERESVFILPCREIENLLLDFDALSAVLSDATGKTIPPAEVEEYARLCADGLKQTVIMKRVASNLVVHRHVPHELRRQLASENVSREKFKKVIIDRLPQAELVGNQIDEDWLESASDIDASWETSWQELAPGAELLSALWVYYLNRGYSKKADGPIIAERMSAPPAALARVLDDFMADD